VSLSPDQNRVTLIVPARTDHLYLLRLNVAAIAGAVFVLDDVEDLKLAIEELGAALVRVPDGDPTLRIDIDLDGETLTVSGHRRTRDPQAIALDGFVETIVDALVDRHTFTRVDDDVRFDFEKRLRDR